ETAAVQDGRAGGARPLDRLPDEAGLPDPSLAADDDDLRLTAGRPRQGVLDPAELDVPADRDRARSGRHEPMVRPRSPPDVAIGDGFRGRAVAGFGQAGSAVGVCRVPAEVVARAAPA